MIYKARVIISVVLLVVIVAVPVLADIDGMLDNIVGGVYVQNPGIYKSPSSTTMSLGSTSFRLKNDLLGKPMTSFTPPRATVSCSGMDFDAGMMSLLNLDQFESMLGQAGASAAWGVMIGLVYSLPGVKDAWSSVQEFAREMQKLAGNSCAIGTALGKNIGSEWWGDKSKKGAENQVGGGLSTAYEIARDTILESLKHDDIYQTVPYSSLAKAGINDPDIRNLLASWFGVFDIYLKSNVDGKRLPFSSGTNLKDCGGGVPCNENNVDWNMAPPLIDSLDQLMNGGPMKIYTCTTLNGDVCDNGINYSETTVVGLRKKIKDSIVVVREMLSGNAAGTALQDNTVKDPSNSAIFAYARVVPNFLDVLNYAAVLKTASDSSLQGMSDTVTDNTSELVGYVILESFIRQARNYIDISSNQDPIVKNKIPGHVFKDYLLQISNAEAQLLAYGDVLNKKYQMHINAYNNYKSLRDYGSKAVVNVFGSGVLMFKGEAI